MIVKVGTPLGKDIIIIAVFSDSDPKGNKDKVCKIYMEEIRDLIQKINIENDTMIAMVGDFNCGNGYEEWMGINEITEWLEIEDAAVWCGEMRATHGRTQHRLDRIYLSKELTRWEWEFNILKGSGLDRMRENTIIVRCS